MSVRRAYLDTCPGERRGVVALDGRPERLWIERDGAPAGPRLGARYRARVSELSPDRRLAFLDLGGGEAGASAIRPDAAPARGAMREAEVVAEQRAGKAASLRLFGACEGTPGLIAEGPDLQARLTAAAPGGVHGGADAREIADAAEEAVLADRFELEGGLTLSIEPTRALTAVDVDWAGEAGVARRRAAGANLVAIDETARLVRLKGLGGTLVIDLVGFPGGDDALRQRARQAFAPDGQGVTVLPVSRLGLLQVARPHRERPIAELLLGPDGALSARSHAQRLVRALEREGRADPGARLVVACAPEVAEALAPLATQLGPRYGVKAELGWALAKADIQRT